MTQQEANDRRGGRVRRARLATFPAMTSEGGFGVIELLIAMTVMAIGISAIVAGFSSGIVALNNASRTGTAGTLADRQMEAYRAKANDTIALDSAALASPSLPPLYLTDSAYPATGTSVTSTEICPAVTTPWVPGTACPVQAPLAGPDGRSYRVDTFIAWDCPLGDRSPASGTPTACVLGSTTVAQPVKKITVVVRDGADPSKTYVRETSTFDRRT